MSISHVALLLRAPNCDQLYLFIFGYGTRSQGTMSQSIAVARVFADPALSMSKYLAGDDPTLPGPAYMNPEPAAHYYGSAWARPKHSQVKLWEHQHSLQPLMPLQCDGLAAASSMRAYKG
jgi:hypothetical protein